MFELENSPHEFSAMGNLVTGWKNKNYWKKRVFWLEFFFHERCFSWHRLCGPRILEVLIATSPPPPPPPQGNTAGRHFVCSSFARLPGKKYARVSHGLTQVVPNIAHLAISMEPTPLLEKVSSCGLLPRLWLLLTVRWASLQSTFFEHFSAFNKYNFCFF